MAESRYQKILVPLDGSGWAQRAVSHAVDIARNCNGELILLNVYKTPAHEYTDQIALAGQGEQLHQGREEIKQYLIGVRTELRDEDLRVRTHLIEGAAVSHLICDYVRAEGIDLIVMSSRGRSGLARLFLGSVAHEVMECADIPVLIVRPDKE